jgi:hypothetical protein
MRKWLLTMIGLAIAGAGIAGAVAWFGSPPSPPAAAQPSGESKPAETPPAPPSAPAAPAPAEAGSHLVVGLPPVNRFIPPPPPADDGPPPRPTSQPVHRKPPVATAPRPQPPAPAGGSQGGVRF